MRLWTREHLQSEKGNALLMALAVIMILTAFSTASLMVSVANIQMSAKYRNWSKDYYDLDMNAEDKLNQLNNVLQNSEKDAQDYMAGQYYLDSEPLALSENLQIPSYAQDYVHANWLNNVAPYMEDLNNSAYQTKLRDFLNDTVQRLYYYYASNQLNQGGFSSVTYLKSSASLSNYQEALFDQAALTDGTSGQVLSLGNLVVDVNSALPIIPDEDSDAIFKEISAVDPDSVNGKSVGVKVEVQFPAYEVALQTKNVPLQGNPVWANAITAAGNIGFVGSGTSTVNGDVFAADSSESLPINDNIPTSNGIYSQGADVEINGNVYTKGNFHITGSASKINVHEYSDDMNITMKDKIYSQNKLYFDLAAAGSISEEKDTVHKVTDYIEGFLSSDVKIPLVYQDINGGNVYCNSLAVEGTYPNHEDQTVSSGEINVDGNVTNYNDIRMDGLQSEITVVKNDIGINSSADATGDPNASSSVINNTPLTSSGSSDSIITLKGNFIVPGTAFAKYKGVKKAGDSSFSWADDIYYQTGESISSSNADIFSAYMAAVLNPDNTDYNYYYDQYTNDTEKPEDNSYYFMRRELKSDASKPDTSDWKTRQLVEYLQGTADNPGKNVVSNIFSGSSVEGYSLGAALLHQPGASAATMYTFDLLDQDYVNYHNFKTCLENIFKAKTQQLGTTKQLNSGNSSDGAFGNFVNKDAILVNGTVPTIDHVNLSSSPTSKPDSFVYSQDASSTLDLSDGDKSGMIYCEGNLNITGNGTFKGAIICEGNVTVSGNPNITYDENVIKETLASYSDFRNFFAPGNRGDVTYYTYTAPSYDGAVRKNVVRYKVLEWKENQQ